MIDEDKLKSKIEGLKSNLIYGACSSQVAMETRCKEEAYNEVLAILDSMQEEHKLKPKFQEGNKIVYVGERKELDTDEHTILYVYDDMYVTTWGKKIPFKFQDDYKLIEEPVSMWHDASETPSIFGTYLLVHDGGWCVARYFGKEVLKGNTTGWVEISKNIFIEHPEKWLDLRDILPKTK